MNILFILWAGSSVPSGIDTFRWFTAGVFNMDFFDINYVKQHKEESVKFYKKLRKDFISKKTNYYHDYISKLIKEWHNINIISQNIDILDKWYDNLLKIHWDISLNRCLNNFKHDVSDKELWMRCEKCNSHIIPNILYYNELYKKDDLDILKKMIDKQYDFCITIGTTLEIPFIKENIVKKVKSTYNININPEFNISEFQYMNYKNLNEFKENIWLILE